MPTARELLEQADALMRRNRARAVDTEIPELTEVVPDAMLLPPAPAALDRVPELNDVVEEIEIASIAELPDDRGEPSEWLHLERDEAMLDSSAAPVVAAVAPMPQPTSVTAEAAPPPPADETAVEGGTGAVESVGAAMLPEATELVASPDTASAEARVATAHPDAPAETANRPAADDWARWQALAEEIRMQVLQRIDIFTDTGLREQLGTQLQPIVDRASAEMVATVNEQIGKLLRAYIAEAIEREIGKWRDGNR